MIVPVQIEDVSRLETWLNALPQETPAQAAASHRVRIALAHRAAMRALPVFERAVGGGHAAVLLQVFRSLLVSGVAAFSPTPGISRASAEAANNAELRAFVEEADRKLADRPKAHVRSFNDALALDKASRTRLAGLVAWAARSAVRAAADAASQGGLAFNVSFALGDAGCKANERDCLASSLDALKQQPLWFDFERPKIANSETFCEALRRDARGWEFWINWYGQCLAGEMQDWGGLLTEIAIIPSEEWEKGPYHIAQLIEELQRQDKAAKAAPDAITVRAVSEAISVNREPLRLQLDALQLNLERELERLRGDNTLDPQVRDLLTDLHKIISALQELLPEVGTGNEQTAGEWASLLAVYKAKLKNWPRLNVDEVVDGTFRVTLIGLSAGAFGLVGLPAWAGAALGGAVFGGNRLVEAAKSLKGPQSGDAP